MNNRLIYQLKTQDICNNNCKFCELMSKKADKEQTLSELEKEVIFAKNKGYKKIKLSCNADNRRDFVRILKMIKKYKLEVILETNARMFFYDSAGPRVKKLVDNYEIIYNYYGWKSAADRQAQAVKGIRNIVNNNKKEQICAKIILYKENFEYSLSLLKQIKELGISRIKFIIPFSEPLRPEKNFPTIMQYVPLIKQLKAEAKTMGLIILYNDLLEHNPFITNDYNFLDTSKAQKTVDIVKHKQHLDISVIIPTRGKEEYLRLVINSFLQQDFDSNKYEIIIVDDGSEKSSEKMIKKLKPKCNLSYIYWPRSEIKSEKKFSKWADFYNRAGYTRNIGLQYARGRVILFNDNDIIVRPNCLKQHWAHHKKDKNIVVRGIRSFVPEGKFDLKKRTFNFDKLDKVAIAEKTDYGIKIHCREYDLKKEGWQRFVTCNLSLRKEHVLAVQGFAADSPFWGLEDVDLGYRLRQLNLRLYWSGDIRVYHLDHPTQTGDKMNTLSVFWINLNILFRKYLDTDMYDLYKDVILNKVDDLI